MGKIQKLIAKMTLEEKAGLCSGEDFWHTKGIERLGIPEVMMTDGPHGLRKQAGDTDHLGLNESVPAVCFPAACAMGSSFDRDLIEDMGKTLGRECQADEVGMLLGPGVNIKRSPLCGRNFEYFSEDPYLTGKMAASYINGLQKQKIGASLKHFAANNQEYRRMTSSSEVSERALREIYLPAFEIAVKEAQPKSVMCSYNKINGEYASENHKLLTEILRDEWGFEGFVVSDWGAVNDRVKALEAGLDLEMPSSGGFNDAKIVKAVEDGTLDEAVLDRAVERILEAVFFYRNNKRKSIIFNRNKDHAKAVDYATECAVLLENNGVLPLNPESKIAYIGGFAKDPRYQGGGSSHINASEVSSALAAAEEKERQVTYAEGFPADDDESDEKAFAEAVEAAKAADVAVVFAGLPATYESEGYDREDMKLPQCQNDLIDEIVKVQKNVVVVLHNGSPVETPWADKVSAVLEMYLAGQGVGEACDRLLYGEANPSGRLAESFPYRAEDNPSYLFFKGDGKKVHYNEDVFVGYRYYDTKKVPVRWAFGHGLSYTRFDYSNLDLSAEEFAEGKTLKVQADIKNVGDVTGKEVVQLYVSDKNGTAERPLKELKGFTKVELEPGETKTVEFELTARDLSYYDEDMGGWYAPTGTYEILLAHASDDLRLSKEVKFKAKKELPFEIDKTTTVGALLAHPQTRDIIMEVMGNFKELLEPTKKERMLRNMDTDRELQKAMQRAMLENMPLKTLVSFDVPGKRVEEIIEELREALKE